MSIKSDSWIRRMASQGMIEPFAAEQVRFADGHKIISYGTSSYGYDVRCASEFKIFTNINTTIVDPKKFDEKSFVDLASEVCIIPPNSFALARTVEYFRIPRNVLTICCGKSTYARCFRGDTRVALADGTAATLEEMARRHAQGERFAGYSIGPNGRLIVTRLDAPRFIGRDCLLEVLLDNGERICATPDHLFMRRDGLMAEASTLRRGAALMPLYRQMLAGRESIYQPLDGQMLPTQLLRAQWRVREGRCASLPCTPAQLLAVGRRSNHAARSERVAQGIGPTTLAGAGPGRARPALARWRDGRAPLHAGSVYRNHRVAAVRELPGEHDVYCLTVPEAGNFALQAGVFVHNCGIIVNVTPLEPEWEGHVTLEFSNTTPLPAKIYANEGVAQVLFFESDEVCETSYRDRGGKYMGQRGVTLPKA
jgi:deoxycytidine triphosphate deaminase